jgi:hypothetical protein
MLCRLHKKSPSECNEDSCGISEPAVLDNFVNSLFDLTAAVTASLKTRRTQEVTSTPPPPPPVPVTGGKGDSTALSRNKKEPGAFSPHRDLPVGGVYDCITYGAWDQTSWFLPVNSLFPPHKTSKTASSGITCLSRPLVRPS